VTISITLPDDLLRQIDRRNSDRSAFLETAVRKLLHEEEKARRRREDAAIINRFADRLNKEAADVWEYQKFSE
jgi:metal-responsive CopG/Arc/MetJ family transcriptional regulator